MVTLNEACEVENQENTDVNHTIQKHKKHDQNQKEKNLVEIHRVENVAKTSEVYFSSGDFISGVATKEKGFRRVINVYEKAL